MPGASVWHSIRENFTFLALVLLSSMCMYVFTEMVLARKRVTLGSVMFAISGIAILFASLHWIRATEPGSWLLAASFLTSILPGWLMCLETLMTARRRTPLTAAQRTVIAGRILACDPQAALKLVRDLTGAGADEANDLHWELYQTLRIERGKGLGFTDEDYWKCLYD